MNKSVILLRSIDMLPDPRVEKYINFYKKKGINYNLVGWNRSKSPQKKENTTYFNVPSHYGTGIANAISILKFNKFIFFYLRKNKNNYTTIHSVDLDTVMSALLAKLLYKKRVIFDIFDWYSHSRIVSNKLLKIVIHLCEWIAVNFSDTLIICDEERKKQIPFKINPNKLIVLPNIPQFNGNRPSGLTPNAKRLRISYVGIFGTNRGIEDMLEVVSKRPEIDFTIGGFGELQVLVESYDKNFENIHYIGKCNYETSLQTMASSDLICAMYYRSIPNHIYAAPNKYYEGLYLGRAILTTTGTIPGIKCEKEKVGFAIEEGGKNIDEFLKNISIEEVKIRGELAQKLWEKKYKELWENTINTYYFNEL